MPQNSQYFIFKTSRSFGCGLGLEGLVADFTLPYFLQNLKNNKVVCYETFRNPQFIIFPQISVNKRPNRVPCGCRVAGWTCHPHECLREIWILSSVKWQTLNAMDFVDAKSWLIGKDTVAGKDWGLEKKGVTEDEIIGLLTQWTWIWANSRR